MKSSNMRLLPVLAGLGVAAVAIGAASISPAGTTSRPVVAASSSPTDPAVPVAPPASDWDHALFDGTDIALNQVSGLQLPFVPAVPRFGLDPVSVQATGARSSSLPALGFAYRLPASLVPEPDARVTVVEATSTMTLDALQNLAASSNSAHSSGTLVTVNGLPGALISGQVDGYNVGRIMVLDHGFTVDITGPQVSPDEVLALSQRVA